MQPEWRGMNTPSSFTLSLVYLPLSFFSRLKSLDGATQVTAEMPGGILKVSQLCNSQATLGTQRLMYAWVNRPPRYHTAPPRGATSRGAHTVPIPLLIWSVPCSLLSLAPSSKTVNSEQAGASRKERQSPPGAPGVGFPSVGNTVAPAAFPQKKKAPFT